MSNIIVILVKISFLITWKSWVSFLYLEIVMYYFCSLANSCVSFLGLRLLIIKQKNFLEVLQHSTLPYADAGPHWEDNPKWSYHLAYSITLYFFPFYTFALPTFVIYYVFNFLLLSHKAILPLFFEKINLYLSQSNTTHAHDLIIPANDLVNACY